MPYGSVFLEGCVVCCAGALLAILILVSFSLWLEA